MKKKTAVVPANAKPLALPDSPFPMPKAGEDSACAAYLARVVSWYEHYFLSTFRTFTRDEIGKRISPGDWHMRMCVSLLASGVVYVPRKDRVKIYAPLKMLLRAIAETWTECAAPALGALDHIAELQGTFNGDDDERITLDEARQLDEKIKAERAGLKDDLRKLSETLLNANAARADEMLAAINATRETLRADIADVRADTTAAAINSHKAKTAAETLLALRLERREKNKERGKTNQATGNTEADERAARDMQTALNRVRDRIKNGAKNVLGECRTVCKEFEPLTTKKNALGKYEAYAPLTGANDEPIKPETLAKNYRERFGTKKANKAKAARALKSKRRGR